MTASLPCLLITMKAIQFQKVSLSDFKILWLFLNKLTTDDKYSLLNRNNLLQHLQMQLSKKQKTFSGLFFFFAFLKSRFIFESFQKKRWSFCLMYFWTYGLRKTWLDKCLKSAVSEDPSTSNMRKGPKHYWNMNDSTFTILIDHCESNSVGESLCLWYAKTIRSVSYHIGSRMTSLLFLRDGI